MWSRDDNWIMPKRSTKKPTKKPPQKDMRQLARPIRDAVVPAAVPTKPAANKARPPRPVKKQDVKDIDRADSEGMGQPQGLPPKKNPATAAPRKTIAKNAAKKR
jgi:hypothetical protein